MTPRITTAGALTALAAVALTGCGGKSEPSKADFAKKADALCAQTNKAHPPKPRPKNAKEAVAQQTEEITIRRELDAKLKKLDVPGDAKTDFTAYNDGTTRIIAAIQKTRADAQKNDEKKYNADLKVFEQAAADREKAAIKLGFKTCGRQNPQ